MNQEPQLSDLAGWQPPGFLTPRRAYKNLVHPPPFSTAPTSVFLDPLIILAHITFILISLTGKQHLGLSTFLPLADHSINQLVSRFLFPCPSHFTVNKAHYHKSLSPELLFCMWSDP
ncbi:hypothetical protein CHARACLAT_013381 [Characodon lateralis]|uniref:Uncharacterized protein n=1 Tax=Characodon lateralis TaxID=208331 RepID=A0ABU7E9C7_9TELE|nr:hypothetical protein [Characodon lateralis]